MLNQTDEEEADMAQPVPGPTQQTHKNNTRSKTGATKGVKSKPGLPVAEASKTQLLQLLGASPAPADAGGQEAAYQGRPSGYTRRRRYGIQRWPLILLSRTCIMQGVLSAFVRDMSFVCDIL